MFFSTSRLFRKTYRTLEFVDRLHKSLQLRCVFVKSGVDTNDKERWESILHMQSLFDQFVVTMYVSNIHAAQEGLLKKQMVFGTLSYGYVGEPIPGEFTPRGKQRSRITIDPETAEIVSRYLPLVRPRSRESRRNHPPFERPRLSTAAALYDRFWSRSAVRGILDEHPLSRRCGNTASRKRFTCRTKITPGSGCGQNRWRRSSIEELRIVDDVRLVCRPGAIGRVRG